MGRKRGRQRSWKGTYWQRQMASHVKRVERPESASSQSNTVVPTSATLTSDLFQQNKGAGVSYRAKKAGREGGGGRTRSRSADPLLTPSKRDDRLTSDRSEGEDEDKRPGRSSSSVDSGEALGGVSGLGEGGEGSRSSVHARKSDRQHRHANDGVDEVVDSLDVGEDHRDNERRGVGSGSVVESVVGVGDHQTDDHERGNVDDGDSPKRPLDCCWHARSGIGGFARCKSYELGFSEVEGAGDDHGADSLERVDEQGVAEVLGSDV